jgi:hypothetical protein
VSTTANTEECFSSGRPVLAAVAGTLTVLVLASVVWDVATDRDLLRIGLFTALGVTQAGLCIVNLPHRLTLADDRLELTRHLRTTRVPWSDVERITIDRAAVATGHGNRAFRVERRDGSEIRNGTTRDLPDGRVDEMEASLRQHAGEHGFEVEVHRPSWAER